MVQQDEKKSRVRARRRVKPCLLVAIVLRMVHAPLIQAAGAAQPADRYEGRLVADVLRQLQSRGAPIIFSTVLVTPDLRVKAEPRKDRTPREVAEEILAPHGLALSDGPGKTWVVVRAPKPAASAKGRGEAPEARSGSAPRSPAASSDAHRGAGGGLRTSGRAGGLA
jgi:hypothetical protein